MIPSAAPSAKLSDLTARLRRVHVLGSVAGLLGWDEQVNLPPGAAEQRGEQMGLLAELAHAEATAPGLGAALAAAETLDARGELADDERVVVTAARRDYDRATKLPSELVAEKARLSSEAYHAWAAARAARDFGAFAPFLEKHLAIARREAELLGYGERPYDLAIDRHDPGLDAARVDALFTRLRAGLVPLARRIDAKVAAARARGEAPVALRGFDVDAQRRVVRDVTARLGFDYARGRLDVSLHPFCEGSGDDVRLTTRFNPDEPLDALYSSIHEAGHGLYEQGLPRAHAGTALGVAAGMAVHESQSRLWENQVARSRAFWRWLEPAFRAAFPGALEGVSGDQLHAAANTVEPGGMIRVDADEVHYNLHILLRFDLEKRLFAGTLAVADLPAAWDALAEEFFGRRPAHVGEGVLQDVHWSGGAFGYFPSYTLGNMIAAQLWSAAQARLPGLEAEFAKGEFGALLGWLRSEVHAHGRREDAFALTRRVTGAELGPEALLAYLAERYDG